VADGSPRVSRLDAADGVTVTGRIRAHDDLKRGAITMVGGLTLHQGTNNISGGRLSVPKREGQ
jgi:lipopolysaccharide export system protein LptA